MKKLEIKPVIFPLQGYSLNFEEEKKRLTNAQSRLFRVKSRVRCSKA